MLFLAVGFSTATAREHLAVETPHDHSNTSVRIREETERGALDDLGDEVALVEKVRNNGHAYAQRQNIREGCEKVLADGLAVGVV